ALTRADGDHHQYRSADRDKYDAVRANYHSNGKGRRLSVTVKGETSRNVKVLTDDYASQEEAMAAAQAEYKRMQRGRQTLSYSLARGRPVGNASLHVLDAQLQPVPRGVIGEICVASPGLARRYLNDDAASARAFVEIEYQGQPLRVYRTGDLGHCDRAGLVHFHGRADRQLK
ncbi:AMP-binding protein, partial [Burkholderia gladioli]|nr:AMP-binding protein [Burkholderia gladioli]